MCKTWSYENKYWSSEDKDLFLVHVKSTPTFLEVCIYHNSFQQEQCLLLSHSREG